MFLFPKCPDKLLGPTSVLFRGEGALFPGVKATGL